MRETAGARPPSNRVGVGVFDGRLALVHVAVVIVLLCLESTIVQLAAIRPHGLKPDQAIWEQVPGRFVAVNMPGFGWPRVCLVSLGQPNARTQ
jgi:hypothetical protein